MPHVIIEGNINLEKTWNSFTKTVEKNKKEIIIFEDAFLNHSKNLMLIMTTVIKENFSQKYFIQIIKKENQITVRLDPLTDPKTKSELVMISIAKMARFVMSINKDLDLSITKTNVNSYL